MLLEAIGIDKAFGAVQALRGASLRLDRGESVGIVGHNGAGKSTLVNVLCGTLTPDAGELRAEGAAVQRFDVREAQRLGIRRVYQELSLCANLTLAENMHVAQPSAGSARGWRARAGDMLMATLDRIFPGHGLHAGDIVADLPIGKRQAVEIARAFTPGREELRLMILDEPTSSLDAVSTGQLLAYIRQFVGGGKSCVLITHKLREVFAAADRVVVMRDGQVVEAVATANTDRARLVAAMGQSEVRLPLPLGEGGGRSRGFEPHAASLLSEAGMQAGLRTASEGRCDSTTAPSPCPLPGGEGKDIVVDDALRVRRGEVIGLAGLAGHGQTQLLVRLRDAADGVKSSSVRAPVAFVAGDRQTDGVFALWSVARNITLSSLAQFRRRGLIDPVAERAAVERWRERLGLVTPDVGMPILSLSGGNQQKVLFARALASSAEIILMDDPMRGVDVGTKRDVYELIAAEAARGRTFIWYTTEFDELFHCDRVYVYSNGRIVGEVVRGELSEEKVLSLSFEEHAP